jgi:hypothetical protein
LALAAALVGWQLFVPPIIGLADQGDFVRLLGPLGYAPQPKGPEHKYFYLTRRFVWDPSYREPRWEQITSEFIPVGIALALNRAFFNPKVFDITIVGFVHALLFLVAFGRLLYVTRSLTQHGIVWAAMLLVLTDVGYVAYWNSLYTEPASCLWFLFLLAESIAICASGRITPGTVLRWSVFAVLLIMAKTQNAALCLPLGAYGFVMGWRAFDRKTRWVGYAGAIAILTAGVVMYRSLLPAPRMLNMYNLIFFAILPESDNPAADLKALGLDPSYARYSGTLGWTAGTGLADGRVVNAIQAHVTPIGLVKFYVQRPRRMWKHVHGELKTALFLRPEFCGNFDASAGRPPGARSHAIELWSRIHERYLSRIATYLLATIMLAPVFGLVLLGMARLTPGFRRWTEMGIGLALCCSMAFFAAALGDAWDVVKHQFLFNLLFDACLVFGLAAGLSNVLSNAGLTGRRTGSVRFRSTPSQVPGQR